MEGPQATPGHRFVVLDVSVRNRDSQPQDMSEGKLIAVNGSELQTFNRPVTVFSDDYLSLQVLAPAQGLHGKIAYEVPEDPEIRIRTDQQTVEESVATIMEQLLPRLRTDDVPA